MYLSDRVVIIDSWIESDERPADRYTVVIDDDMECCLAASEDPFHPQGFGQHVEVSRGWVEQQVEEGRQVSFDDVPEPVQRFILRDIAIIDAVEVQA